MVSGLKKRGLIVVCTVTPCGRDLILQRAHRKCSSYVDLHVCSVASYLFFMCKDLIYVNVIWFAHI